MKRWLKWGVGIIASLIVLIVVILFLLTQIINPNDYKPKIASIVYEKTGLRLAIDGDISWRFLPSVGFSVSGLRLKNTDDAVLAAIKQASVNISLPALVSKKVVIHEAVIDGANISVIKKIDGSYNWPSTTQKKPQPSMFLPVSNSTAPEKVTPPAHNRHFTFKINKVRVENIDLHYQDKTRQQDLRLRNAFLNAENLSEKQAFPMQAGMLIKGKNPDVNMRLTLKGNVKTDFGKNHFAIDNLDLALKPLEHNPSNSEFTLTGKVALKDKALDFDLKGSPLDLRNYLPESGSSEHTKRTSQNKSQSAQIAKAGNSNQDTQPEGGNALLIPVALLQAFNVNGNLVLEKLLYNNISLEKPKIKLTINEGVADINHFNALFYDGTIEGKARVNTRYSMPNVSVNADMKGVNLKKAGAAIGHIDRVNGDINASLRLLAQGTTERELVKTLNGLVSFHVNKGDIEGVNMNHMVCRMVAKIRNKKINKKDWPSYTRFTSLKGSWNIENGIARSHDLVATLENLKLNANGWIDIPESALDYHIGLTVTGGNPQSDEPACEINPRYADIVWPVRCEGDLKKSVSCDIDQTALEKTAKTLLKREAKHHLQKELMKHFGSDGMGKTLQKLLH